MENKSHITAGLTQELAKVCRDAGQLLRNQNHLGLLGLDLADDILTVSIPQAENRDRGSTYINQEKPRADEISIKAIPQADTAPSVLPIAKNNSEETCVTFPDNSSLAQIVAVLGDCSRCALHQQRTHIVFGVGAANARLMFVGEGPGRDEDLHGEPFVGQGGQLLDKMIVAMGLKRREVYMTDIIKCRPPQNRGPKPEEITACNPFLLEQIKAVKPEVIVALGRYAAQTLLQDTTTPIGKLRGHWRTFNGIPLMPTFHPAYLLRNSTGKKPVWEDLQKVMKRLMLINPRTGKIPDCS